MKLVFYVKLSNKLYEHSTSETVKPPFWDIWEVMGIEGTLYSVINPTYYFL